MSDLVQRLRAGLEAGAIDLADIMDAADEIERLWLAIRRLADQDATLSVVGGGVIVEVDATLTDEEREAVERGYCSLMGVEDMSAECTRWDAEAAATLRGLLEKNKPHAQPERHK